jgi:2-phosphoglycolate phosphatase
LRRCITSETICGTSARRRPDIVRLNAVLFDVDGTLLDTREAWIAAFDAGLAAVRRVSMPGAVAAQWIGTPIEVIYAERCGLSGDELAKAVQTFQRTEAESVRQGIRAYPRVREMLASLGAWKLAAVTNKRHNTTVEALRISGLLSSFALVLGGDSVPRKKPAPDPVLKAAEGLGVSPRECVLVGDTEVDVQAARQAGARSIGVTWGYGSRTSLEAAGVDHLIETPDALPPLIRALTPSTAA